MIGLTDEEYAKLLKAAGGVAHATRYIRDVLLRHLSRVKT
jgi:hypothetical protein